MIEVAPVKTAIFGKTFAELDGLENTLGERASGSTSSRSRPVEGRWRKAKADADPPLVIAKAILHALTSDKPKTRYLAGHGRKETAVAAALPDRARDPCARPRARASQAGVARGGISGKEPASTDAKPRVLIVYFSLTQQSAGRRGDVAGPDGTRCDVTKAAIEFTDERWVGKLSQPDEAPDPPDREHPPGTDRPQDRRDPHPAGCTGGRVRPRRARVSDLVVPDEHADPLVPRVAGREGDPRRQALRDRVDLPAVLQHQPRATTQAR